jgi:hypothetical protein
MNGRTAAWGSRKPHLTVSMVAGSIEAGRSQARWTIAEEGDARRIGTWDQQDMSPNEKNRGHLSLGSSFR